MRLPVSTWPDIEAWLNKSKTIVIPIVSFEQHWPNGFIGTDALCPEIIANHAESLAPDDILSGRLSMSAARSTISAFRARSRCVLRQ